MLCYVSACDIRYHEILYRAREPCRGLYDYRKTVFPEKKYKSLLDQYIPRISRESKMSTGISWEHRWTWTGEFRELLAYNVVRARAHACVCFFNFIRKMLCCNTSLITSSTPAAIEYPSSPELSVSSSYRSVYYGERG